VHVKGQPLAGSNGPAFGLGLWRHLPPELAMEAAMAILALVIYRAAVSNTSSRWIGMVVYIVALTVFLISGQVGAADVPPRATRSASWMAVPPAMSAIAFWLDRRRQAGGTVRTIGMIAGMSSEWSAEGALGSSAPHSGRSCTSGGGRRSRGPSR